VAEDRVNLLGLPRSELEAFVAERLGAKPFRARQVLRWIHQSGEDDFARMSDLAKVLREKLAGGRDLIETVRGLGYRMSDPAEP